MVHFHVSHFKIRVNYPSITPNRSHSYSGHSKNVQTNASLVFHLGDQFDQFLFWVTKIRITLIQSDWHVVYPNAISYN
ncbi:hypothetical protein Gotur_022914 [Gossypium turneri]